MAWNLPDGKKPSFSGKDSAKKDGSGKGGPEKNGHGGGAVQRASSWVSLLNCFEGGRFRPLRFSVMLAVVLLLAQAVHEVLQSPAAEKPAQAKQGQEKTAGEKP